MRIFCSHNLGLSIIAILMVTIYILRITVFQILGLILCKKRMNKLKNLKRVSEEDCILEGNKISKNDK
jgi:hypothetical protein